MPHEKFKNKKPGSYLLSRVSGAQYQASLRAARGKERFNAPAREGA